ncbi:MAG: YceD family protein [Cyanobacteriota bacterium]|nr:YceD family protein [Cyanobacteriota bacterium]
METVYIPHLLQRPKKLWQIELDSHLPGLDSLTPVRGQVIVIHQHTYLEVEGEAETILTLSCDRCLQNYNHRVAIQPRELIWLRAPLDLAKQVLEQEIEVDDLVETLPPNGHFDPATWVYEQICLALPQRQICSPDCSGISLSPIPEIPVIDRRWSALSQLQRQLKGQDS